MFDSRAERQDRHVEHAIYTIDHPSDLFGVGDITRSHLDDARTQRIDEVRVARLLV
jgi:hypothetical protein